MPFDVTIPITVDDTIEKEMFEQLFEGKGKKVQNTNQNKTFVQTPRE